MATRSHEKLLGLDGSHPVVVLVFRPLEGLAAEHIALPSEELPYARLTLTARLGTFLVLGACSGG